MALVRRPLRAPVTTQPERYQAAFHGDLPAEALGAGDQERLVRELVWLGWTDMQIAVHTRWSTYVVGRIRDRLGLAANGMLRGSAG